MDEMKKVIVQLTKQFIEEEKGNRVTANNMSGLLQQVMAALDGQITMTPPTTEPIVEEPK